MDNKKLLMEQLKAKYNPTVRIGNWNEEMYGKEDKIRDFLDKRSRGELVIQKTRQLFTNLLREIEIEPPCEHIRFGAIVQIHACDMPSFDECNPEPMALSIIVSEKNIAESQHVSNRCDLTVAPSKFPCVRNTFRIVSTDCCDRTGHPLIYDEDFFLECVDGDCQPLVVYSSPKGMDLMNTTQSTFKFYSSLGEENQPVGICRLNETGGCLVPVPVTHCRWKVRYLVPALRFEMEGEPVAANTRVIINNVHSNRNLATEMAWIQTFFGPELGVTATNYKNVHRRETRQNIWKFVTQQ